MSQSDKTKKMSSKKQSSSQQVSSKKQKFPQWLNLSSKPIAVSSSCQTCSICLQPLPCEPVSLSCQHKLCSFTCAASWWQSNQHCPYCRQFITTVKDCNGKILTREQIKEQEDVKDQDYVARCYQCRADIQEGEKIWQCRFCCDMYVHQQCLPFKDAAWLCGYCMDNTYKGNQIPKIIPFNPVIIAFQRAT